MSTRIKNILLVEDDPQDAELTLLALTGHHDAHVIMVLKNGVEALDYLYRRGNFVNRIGLNPAVIVLDLKMPKISGMEVLRVIKSDAQLKIIPTVILSSSKEKADLLEAYRLGVNAYVVKPVDCVEFMNVIKELGIFWTAVNEPPIEESVAVPILSHHKAA